LGNEIVFYEQDADYYARRRDFSACEYSRLVLYRTWDEARLAALAEAASSDVVLSGSYVPAGARINDELLALPRPLHVFYDLDTPVTLAGLENGELAYLRRDQIAAFDLYLSFTGGAILEELEGTWGARRARPLYGCVDPEAHTRVAQRPEFTCDLSYMGTYSADRQHKLGELLLRPAEMIPHFRFVLAGSLYPWQWEWPPNVKRFEHVAPADHAALYSSSRATLNLTREGMAGRDGYCPSGRLFEAAACGAPIVSDWFEGLDRFFSPGDEIFVVRNAEEIVAALRCTGDELHGMAERARQRALEEHSGMRRARQLLDYLNEGRPWPPARQAFSRSRKLGANAEPGAEVMISGKNVRRLT
jgi:spore maturation protein CgeB